MDSTDDRTWVSVNSGRRAKFVCKEFYRELPHDQPIDQLINVFIIIFYFFMCSLFMPQIIYMKWLCGLLSTVSDTPVTPETGVLSEDYDHCLKIIICKWHVLYYYFTRKLWFNDVLT